ncbi:MAG: GNAT family N-acetyltransferase [Spirochaetales bacterium]
MGIGWLDWFGYLASVVILVSLTMSSIVKLRWINLAGAAMFSTYGFLIGSIPTGGLNLGIAIVDIYYLVRLYREKDHVAIVRADAESEIFRHFWKVNRDDIARYFGNVRPDPEYDAFFYLRNNNTAGVLLGTRTDESTFRILVDYVTPQYRDLRIGQYVIAEANLKERLPEVHTLVADAGNTEHQAYLERLGFERIESQSDGGAPLYERSI